MGRHEGLGGYRRAAIGSALRVRERVASPNERRGAYRPKIEAEVNEMILGGASSVVASPVDGVYQFVVTDFAHNYRRWSPEVQRLEILTDGPIRLGSQAR